jgi:membrane protein YdbS with pleckstrin-like domain
MDELKKWLPELLLDTIVAVVATLLTYIVGLEKTWDEAFQTFFIAFAIMFLLGIYNRRKYNKKE